MSLEVPTHPVPEAAVATHELTVDGHVEVVRHEEELAVRLSSVPYERVRLSKRVVTETVTVEVHLRREELVVERLPLEAAEMEPATSVVPRPAASRLRDSVLSRFAARRQPAAVSADEVSLELLKERYEVVKRVVPRERARLIRELTSPERR